MEAVLHSDSGRIPRILIADSDINERSMYAASLHGAGCDTIEASDGRDALAKSLVRRPSLIVSDAELPIVDGYTLCALLRQDSVTHDVPIIMLIAESRLEYIQRGRDAGASVVMLKPASGRALVQASRRLLAIASDLRHRSREVQDKTAAQLEKSAELQARVVRVREAFLRKGEQQDATTIPPRPPPALICPKCDRPLMYQHSYTGGVGRHPEQWDYFKCSGHCGTFQYRQRTRTLRAVE